MTNQNNLSIAESSSNTESSIISTLSAISSSPSVAVSTLKNEILTTETDLNRSHEYEKVQKRQNSFCSSVDNIELKDKINELSSNESNILSCDKVSS